MCGLLQASLYGTRDAAMNWEGELGQFLESIGFVKGKASACLYTSAGQAEGEIVSVAVNGDDCTFQGPRW